MAAFNLTKLLLAMTGYTLAAATSMDIVCVQVLLSLLANRFFYLYATERGRS
jgi:hypothetical protein